MSSNTSISVGFIGAGMMASALMDGLIAKEVCAPSDLSCSVSKVVVGQYTGQFSRIRYSISLGKFLMENNPCHFDRPAC